MGNFTQAKFLFHVSSDLIRLDAKVCSEEQPRAGDDAAVMTRGENNMVLLDARCRTVGRWDADTDIDMHNIAAYSQHLANCSIQSHTCGLFSLLHIIFIHSPVCYHLQLMK